jgi:hypothetical protein
MKPGEQAGLSFCSPGSCETRGMNHKATTGDLGRLLGVSRETLSELISADKHSVQVGDGHLAAGFRVLDISPTNASPAQPGSACSSAGSCVRGKL